MLVRRENGRRVVAKINGERVPLDQVHIPDPVSQELCRLNQRIEELYKRLEK